MKLRERETDSKKEGREIEGGRRQTDRGDIRTTLFYLINTGYKRKTQIKIKFIARILLHLVAISTKHPVYLCGWLGFSICH